MPDSAGQLTGLSVAEAATKLGVSERTLRRWVTAAGDAEQLNRPGLPAITILRGGMLRLLVADAAPGDAGQTPDSAGRVPEDNPSSQALIDWLKARLEAAEAERAELRRMLNLEQQKVAELIRALPAPTTPEHIEEMPAEQTEKATPSPPEGMRLPEELRQGVGGANTAMKPRRGLLARLAAVWRGD